MAAGLLDYRYILRRAEDFGWRNPRRQSLTQEEVARAFAESVPNSGIENDPQDDSDLVHRPSKEVLEPLEGGFRWSDFDGQPVPAREWVVENWIGRNHVTSLHGKGGVGKSVLSQQVATCIVTGQPFLGLPTIKGRVLGLFCEDDRDELRRRADWLNKALGTRLHDLDDFHAHARVGLNNVLLHADSKTGLVMNTSSWRQLELALETANAAGSPYVLVILDNAAQMLAVNEINREQVTQALNRLAGLADRYRCGILLLGHPAKPTDSQYSGSTAWDACVRSRLLLARPKDNQGKECGSKDDRVLSQAKANYAATEDIPIRWFGGAYVRTDEGEAAAATREEGSLRTREVIDCLKAAILELKHRGVTATDESSSRLRYLPKLMEVHDLTEGYTAKELGKALGLAIAGGEVVQKVEKQPGQRRNWTVLEVVQPPVQHVQPPVNAVG